MNTKTVRKDALQKLADELEKVLDQKEEILAVLAPFEEKERELRQQLLEKMRQKGYKYVSATSGLGWGITNGRKTFAIKKGMEETAMAWALKDFPAILAISTAKLGQVIKPMLNLPEFVEEKKGEDFLTVRQAETGE